MDDPRISTEVVKSALTEWFGGGGHRHQWHPKSVNSMARAIAAADRVRGRSYIEWRRPEEFVPDTKDSDLRIIIVDLGPEKYGLWSDTRLPDNTVAWAEMPAGPAWAETTPHADEPGRVALSDPVRAHAICMSRMVEMLLGHHLRYSLDVETLARMRRAAYPERGE